IPGTRVLCSDTSPHARGDIRRGMIQVSVSVRESEVPPASGRASRRGAQEVDVMASRYWIDVSTSPTHLAQLERIPPASKVLEIGAAGGHMTRALVERGCRVWAIEAEPSLASGVQDVASRLIVGDIEGMDLEQAVGGERFDVILLGDVLEHLRHPDRVLHRLQPLLVSSGHLVVSLPNVAHG